MNFTGTAGDDNLTGTNADDTFDLSQGGNDTASGGNGNDVFEFGATFGLGDSIDGGTGSNTLELDGDYWTTTLAISSLMMRNVQFIDLAAGHSYDISIYDRVIGEGQSLTIDGRSLLSTDTMQVMGGYMTGASASSTLVVYSGACNVNAFVAGPGRNILHGGTGGDIVSFGANFNATDHLDGGATGDANYLYLDGDYSAGLTITPSMLQNFQVLEFATGFSFAIALKDGVVADGQTFTVLADMLGAGDSLSFDGSGNAGAAYQVDGGAGNISFRGGDLADTFTAGTGGIDDLRGNGGDDLFVMGATFVAADHIDGGSGNNAIDLAGDYSAGVKLHSSTLKNISEFAFDPTGNDYKITMADANLAAGQTMYVNGDVLTDDETLTFNAAKETNATYILDGGAGDDVLTGGQFANTFLGGLGQDTMTAGNGADVFQYGNGVAASTGPTHDVIVGFNALQDSFNFPVLPEAVDPEITSGQLRKAHFDSDLASAADAAHLGINDAVLFTPSSGNLAGHTYLIVNANGEAGYQAGEDFVVELSNATHLASFGTGNFS